jgi:hypothetical protein
MYKLTKIIPPQTQQTTVQRLSDNAFIPFNPANTDYANFKKEVLAGAELQDADGNVMTQEQAKTYVATLP